MNIIVDGAGILEKKKNFMRGKENKMAKTKKRKGWMVALGMLFFVIILIAGVGILVSDSEIKTEVSQAKVLNAEITFDGVQFIITNKDSYAWTAVKFQLNGGIVSDGYVLRCSRIEAKTTYTVGALQFAKSDGTRFNPAAVKPQSIVILADQGDCDLYWK